MPTKKPLPINEANTFLKNELAHLWPAIANNNKLQKVCSATLPQLFLYCQVLRLEQEQLTIAAPNAALASKLKQQIPKLQMALEKAGWQIATVRIKVQTSQTFTAEPAPKQLQLSNSALDAFNILEKNLARNNPDTDLVGALRDLLLRHRIDG
jgi:hypothetical protein